MKITYIFLLFFLGILFSSLTNCQDKLAEKRMVSGYVRTTQKIPISQILVEAFDKKVGKTTLLGKNKSNEEGFYQIEYAENVEKTLNGKQFDLFVQCYVKSVKEKYILVKSDLLINAPHKALINITIPREFHHALLEFEKISKKFDALIRDRNLKNLTDDDFNYLVAELRLEINKLKHYVYASFLKHIADNYKNTPKISAEIFYALITYDELIAFNEITKWEVSDWEEFLFKNNLLIPVDEVGNKSTKKQYAEELCETFTKRFPITDLICGLEKSKILSDKPVADSIFYKFSNWTVDDWDNFLNRNKLPLPVNKKSNKLTIEEYAQKLAQIYKKHYSIINMIESLEKSRYVSKKKKKKRFYYFKY